jgi:Uma2 family endonuclease
MSEAHSQEALPPAPEAGALVLHLRPVINLTKKQFFKLCQLNRDLRLERTAEGDILVMPPTGARTGARNFELSVQFGVWAKRDGSGIAFDSSTGFELPNGAMRSPDVAWVRRARLAAVTPPEREKFLPLCPDFVVELCSPSDSLRVTQEKMTEYCANGAQLGWLIDPEERRVYVYRPGASVEPLDAPAQLSGDPVLPGFVLDLAPIWEPGL